MSATVTYRDPVVRSHGVTLLASGFMLASLSMAAILMILRPIGPEWLSLKLHSGSGGVEVALAWLAGAGGWLSWTLIALAMVCFVLSFAVLCRLFWARQAFIALMAIGFVGVVSAVALSPLVFALAPEGAIGEQINTQQPLMGLVGALGLTVLVGTLLAGVFAWAAWVLVSPAVRAEFSGTGKR